MAETGNPYESPQTEVQTVKPLAGRVLTETMIFYLKGASPWLRFIGIMGFISLGLTAVNFLTLIAAYRNIGNILPGMENLGSAFLLVVLLSSEALVFFPTVFVFRFGRKIRAYLHSGNDADLEQAFRNNKFLWTYIGIIAIVFLAFFGIVMAAMLVTALAQLI